MSICLPSVRSRYFRDWITAAWGSWATAAAELKTRALLKALAARETAQAEDMMRGAVVAAHKYFNQMIRGR